MPRSYIAIDLKSFYASVECVERGMAPMQVHLVVADESRTEKTICLAATPAIKKHGVPSRARLFEVVEKVREINALRRRRAPGGRLEGASYVESQLQSHPHLAMDFIRAVPRMGLYMQYSTRIYQLYLRYAVPEDIHVYSIDEVFIDATPYLRTYGTDGRGFAAAMMLGAEAVQIGTRFVASKECAVHANYKERILKAKDIDSEVTGRSTGHPIRVIRNKMTKEYLKKEQEGASFEELEQLTLGALRNAVVDGDVMYGSVMAGQIAGLIKEEKTCKEIIEEIVSSANALTRGE